MNQYSQISMRLRFALLTVVLVVAYFVARRSHGQTVLLVMSEDVPSRHRNLVDQWRFHATNEGWTVREFLTPRSAWDEPFQVRTGKVSQILTEAERVKPRAVFLLGAVARSASGFLSPDGQGLRVSWSDSLYDGSIESSQLGSSLDQQSFTNRSLDLVTQRNRQGDGRLDIQSTTNRPRWAVSRVDFSGLPELPRGINPTPGTYSYGRPRVPAVDEHDQLQRYLVRNIEYRARLAKYQQVVAYPFGLDPSSMAFPTNTAVTNIVWGYPSNVMAGADVYGLMVNTDYRFHYNGSTATKMIQSFFTHCSRVWELDPNWAGTSSQLGDQGARRWLVHSLVVAWGPQPYRNILAGPTIADGYFAEVFDGNSTTRPLWRPVLLGDPTLLVDIRQPPKPRPVLAAPSGFDVISTLDNVLIEEEQ